MTKKKGFFFFFFFWKLGDFFPENMAIFLENIPLLFLAFWRNLAHNKKSGALCGRQRDKQMKSVGSEFCSVQFCSALPPFAIALPARPVDSFEHRGFAAFSESICHAMRLLLV